MHSVEYRRPAGMKGRRVLVVGAGNSAGEISVELARAGADVTAGGSDWRDHRAPRAAGHPDSVRVRHPPSVATNTRAAPHDGRRAGCADLVCCRCQSTHAVPEGPADRPRTGRRSARRDRSACQGGLTAFTAGWCLASAMDPSSRSTRSSWRQGFELHWISWTGRFALDPCGFGRRRDRVVSLDHPSLYFVGHNYDTRGGLYNISIDAARAAREVIASPA